MKTLKIVLVGLIIANFTLSWTLPKVNGQDYYEDPNKKVLKQAVVGAGVGAISAEASGGSAGKGALIGAGTNVIGSAVLDTLTTPSAPRPQPQVTYVETVPERTYTSVEVDTAPRRGGCGRNG